MGGASVTESQVEILRLLIESRKGQPALLWSCLHEEFPSVEQLGQALDQAGYSEDESAKVTRLYGREAPPSPVADAEEIALVFAESYSQELVWAILTDKGWDWDRWSALLPYLPEWAKSRLIPLDPEVYPASIQHEAARVFGSEAGWDQLGLPEGTLFLLYSPCLSPGQWDSEVLIRLLKITPAPMVWDTLQRLGWDQGRKAIAVKYLPDWARTRISHCRALATPLAA